MAIPMEFWGVEVKAGQPLKVNPGEAKIIHLSQASLGESKNKASEHVPVHVKFGGHKLVLGTLSSEHFPQISFDLVFEKEFELSHNWKNGSVFFCGYSTMLQEEDEHSGESDDESSDEDIPLTATATGNGNGEAKPSTAVAKAPKPESSGKKVTIAEPAKMEVDSEDDDTDEDEENDSEDDSEDEDDSDEEDEETPKKVEVGKKRPADSAAKTPVSDKKVKVSTPQKTDGKKGSGHTATPHPKKKDAKAAPASSSKDAVKGKQEQTPGQVMCGTCSKTFKSEGALQSHSKAKHSTAK